MFRAANSRIPARVVVTAFAAASFLLAGCSEMLSREDFAARVKDKSDTEVSKIIGKPAAVEASEPDKVTWIYNSKTFNIEEKNKFDTKSKVVFSKAAPDGKLKATDVSFE